MKVLAVALEIIASCLVVSGICLEVVTGGEAGYIIITAGALGIVAGGILYAKTFINNHQF